MNTDVIKFSIQEVLNNEIKKEREKKEQKTWYCSGLGTDIVGRYYERLGEKADEEFDDRTLRVFSVGIHMEDWIVDLVKKSGVECETQVRVENKVLNLSGKIDLMVNIEGHKIIYEIKSKHSKAFHWMKKEGIPKHQAMQLYAYLRTLNIDEGRLIIISKDDLCINEYIVKNKDLKWERPIVVELKILNEAWKTKIPPPPVVWDWENEEMRKMTVNDWQYKYSRYKSKINLC